MTTPAPAPSAPTPRKFRVTLRRPGTMTTPTGKAVYSEWALTEEEAVYRAKRRATLGDWFDIWASDISVELVEVLA